MVSKSSTTTTASIATAALALPHAAIAYPLPNEANTAHVTEGRIDYRRSPGNETANEIKILFSNNEMQRQMADLQSASMTALQNHRAIAEQVGALSVSVANLQRIAFTRMLDDDAAQPLAIESGLMGFAHVADADADLEALTDLLAAAADAEYFPQIAVQLSRKHISSADNLLRMTAARVLALAGDKEDRSTVQNCLGIEKNEYVKKVMVGALEASQL